MDSPVISTHIWPLNINLPEISFDPIAVVLKSFPISNYLADVLTYALVGSLLLYCIQSIAHFHPSFIPTLLQYPSRYNSILHFI